MPLPDNRLPLTVLSITQSSSSMVHSYFLSFSYKFNDIPLPDDDTYKVTIRMFLEFGLVHQFHIPYKVSF